MNKRFRVAVVGYAQMHIKTLVRDFALLPEFELIGCADMQPLTPAVCTKPDARAGVRANLLARSDMPREYDDYRQLLDEKPDVAVIATENARHVEAAGEALKRGILTVIEKPMTAALEDALTMRYLSQAYHAPLLVNWPTTWRPAVRLARRLVLDGAIGRMFKFHYRNGESLGPLSYGAIEQQGTFEENPGEWWYQRELGGGCMIDYIGYGCLLSRWFFDQRAASAFAVKANFTSQYAPVDDFAAATVCYPSGVALLEGTWTTWAGGAIPAGPIAFGERGTLVAEGDEVRVHLNRHDPKPSRVYAAEPLPAGRENVAQEALCLLRDGTPAHETLRLDVNVDAAAAMDAALRAAVSGKLEPVRMF